MKTQPTLFINRVTTVDCAILSQWGISVGNKMFSEAMGFSFNVNVELSGRLDPIENVVVDFGALKKFLKSEIDNIDYGYDHKLIVPASLVSMSDELPLQIQVSDSEVIINNGGLELLRTPRNAIRVTQTQELDERLSQSVGFLESMIRLEFDRNGDYFTHEGFGIDEVLYALGLELQDFLQQCVNRQYPDQNIIVEGVSCDCETVKPHGQYVRNVLGPHVKRTVSNYFSYTHGLKNSTSVGCKNIVHGHLSYIQLVSKKLIMSELKENNEHVAELQQLCKLMAQDLNCTHFVHSENVIVNEHGSYDAYTAQGRGYFNTLIKASQEVPKPKGFAPLVSNCLFGKIEILDTESTVENLMNFVFNKYEDKLRALEVSSIYISEGLHKGSFYHIN